jgi:hypothetical protein
MAQQPAGVSNRSFEIDLAILMERGNERRDDSSHRYFSHL